MPEKLPLPADWYKDWDAGTADVDAGAGTHALGEAGAHSMLKFAESHCKGE